MKRTYSVYYLTIFVLSLSYQLIGCCCLSNYTFTSMDDFNKTIPAVCSLTLQCQGARNSSVPCDNNNMDSSEECTFNASSLLTSTQTFCNGSSRVTVDINITVAIVEENNAFNVISESKLLTCSPILSCNERNVNITWERLNFNETASVVLNSSMSNGTEQMVGIGDYGNYTCTATSGNMTEMVTYSLYGGPSFSDNSESRRVNLHDSVEFSCNPISVPPVISFVWMKDDENLTNQSQSTLTIEEASYDDEGVYKCVVNNPFNTGSKRFELKVKSPLTPLWPALGIIIELLLVAVIIFVYEFKKLQEKKEIKQPASGVEQKDDDVAAYNFPSHSHHQRHRVDSITKESLLPDSVQ